jgi:predicted deacylase
VQGCLKVMGDLGMLEAGAIAPQVSHIEYFAEDPRDNSGHLQIQHPSPIEGFFEPAVELGERVEEDDLIGTVCDVLGETIKEVRATETGIILMLRWGRHANAGDALGAILPEAYLVRGGA